MQILPVDSVGVKRIGMEETITEIIEGGATGADTIAGWWAGVNQVTRTTVPANWKKHGKSAGPIRNQAMLALRPDLVIAFPGGKGTKQMTGIARDGLVRVMEVSA